MLRHFMMSVASEVAITCHRYDVHIVDEVFLNVELCLVALPGTKREDIRRVLSDTASLQQCENFIRGLPGSVRREAVGDTAGAAQTVAENQLRCSSLACEIGKENPQKPCKL